MNLDLQKVLPAEAFETEQNKGDYMKSISTSVRTSHSPNSRIWWMQVRQHLRS